MLAYVQDKIVKIKIILLATKITARFIFLIFFLFFFIKTGKLGESL